MQYLTKYALRVLLGLAGIFLIIAQGYAMNLMDAWALALAHDPDYQAARYARDAGMEEEQLGVSALLPKVGWDYQQARNYSSVNGARQHNQRRYTSAVSTWSLQQPLLDYEAWARYQRGKAGARQAYAQFREQHLALMVRLFQAWNRVLLEHEKGVLLLAQNDTLREQLRLNQRLLQAGEGTQTDLLETRARVELAEAQLLEQRDEFDIAVKTLESIIGRPLRSALPGALRDGFHPKPLVHNDFQYWLTMAVKHNAQLQRLDETLTVAKYDIERQRAGHFPRMSLVANRRNSHSENESNYKQRYDTGTLGIQVSVPLFSGGAVAAATRQAQAQYQRTAWEKTRETDAIAVALRQHFTILTRLPARIAAYKQAENAASVLVDATRKSVIGGERINLDVLNAWSQLYNVRSDLARARHDWLLAWVSLHFYAGTLDDDKLRWLAAQFVEPAEVSGAHKTHRRELALR